MNRHAAITALVAAVPGLAMAADRPIKLEPLGFGTNFDNEPLRIACRFKPDGWVEIPLDNWCGWRVMLGGESIEISAAELFEALKVRP